MIALFKTEAERRHEHEHARAAQFDKLPEPIRRWALELEREGRKEVAGIRKAAEQKRKPLEAEAATVQARIDALAGELTAAEQWLRAIPAEAEPSAVTERLTIKTLWPQRIQEQRDKLASMRARIDQVDRETNAALDVVRVRVNLTIVDANKALDALQLDVLS